MLKDEDRIAAQSWILCTGKGLKTAFREGLKETQALFLL